MTIHANRPWLLALAVVIGAMALVVGPFHGGLLSAGEAEPSEGVLLPAYTAPSMGRSDAPITMIEYGDFL